MEVRWGICLETVLKQKVHLSLKKKKKAKAKVFFDV